MYGYHSLANKTLTIPGAESVGIVVSMASQGSQFSLVCEFPASERGGGQHLKNNTQSDLWFPCVHAHTCMIIHIQTKDAKLRKDKA